MCRCKTIWDCLQGCVKTLLVLVNVIVGALAALWIALGAYIIYEVKRGPSADAIDDPTIGVAIGVGLLLIGCVSLLITLLGCSGACTGSEAALKWYIRVLVTLIVLQVVGVVFGIIYRKVVEEVVAGTNREAFNAFNDVSRNATNLQIMEVTSIQLRDQCCGLTGPEFWTNPDWNGGLPPSCCINDTHDTCSLEDAYTQGCLEPIRRSADNLLVKLMIYKVIFIVFLGLCIAMAHYSKSKNRNKDPAYGKLLEDGGLDLDETY